MAYLINVLHRAARMNARPYVLGGRSGTWREEWDLEGGGGGGGGGGGIVDN